MGLQLIINCLIKKITIMGKEETKKTIRDVLIVSEVPVGGLLIKALGDNNKGWIVLNEWVRDS